MTLVDTGAFCAYVGQPWFVLPRRNRLIRSQYQHAVTGTQVGASLGQLFVTPIQFFQQHALIFEARRSRCTDTRLCAWMVASFILQASRSADV